MKIITVANRKGGTGKSTTAFNLGYTYALDNKKVLFMDFDSQANLTLLCNVEPSTLDDFKEGKVMRLNAFVDVLPATKRMNQLEDYVRTEHQVDPNGWIKNCLIPKVSADYDYIIIDTPPSLNLLNLNAFFASDMIHIIVNPDFFSLSGLVEMEEIITQVKRLNTKLDYKIIMNSFVKGRNFTDGVLKGLNARPAYTDIRIPNRQHIIDCSAKRRPAIEHPDILEPFKAIGALV